MEENRNHEMNQSEMHPLPNCEINQSSNSEIDQSVNHTQVQEAKQTSSTNMSDISQIPHQSHGSRMSSILTLVASVTLSSLIGFGSGYYSSQQIKTNTPPVLYTAPITTVVANSGNASALSITDVASLTAESVVEITTETMVLGRLMQQAISQGAGSGVIVTTDGYVITNHHVVDGATKINVRLKDGTTYEATLIGSDAKTDIALLKMDATHLQAAIFGDSSKLQVGESVIAVGNPLGQLGGTVTDGIISALDREITIGDETMRLLQTNAAINPGNSGGGLFNLRGELIGIVNAKSSGSDIEGLGFAIPSNDAKAVIEDLMEFGYVKGRVQLGVSLVSITNSQAAAIYRVSEYGIYVQDITANSAAQEAGLAIGDRIVSFHGKEITEYSELKTIIDSLEVNQTVSIVVNRDGKEVMLSIRMKEYTPPVTETKQG